MTGGFRTARRESVQCLCFVSVAMVATRSVLPVLPHSHVARVFNPCELINRKIEPVKTSARRSKSARKAKSVSKAALGRYLAAGLGATGLASMECEAAIVNLDIASIGEYTSSTGGPGYGPGSISGVNAGVPQGQVNGVYNAFPNTARNSFYVMNGYSLSLERVMTGLVGGQKTQFATANSFGTPKIFSAGQLVDNSPSNNFLNPYYSAFQGKGYYGIPFSSPSITGPGNYMGFQTGEPGNYIYGYFEVTWNQTSSEFQILSGAYESTPNTPIAVPEPSAIALTGIGALALGAGAIRRSRKARKVAA